MHVPSDAEELARLLAGFHARGEPVTIRNTGHSVNGQTVTDGVQVHVSGLRELSFDEESLRVKVGAGRSWHDVFQAIRLPEHCTDVFPNNPRKQIHIGGTAAVGGFGFFSSRYGAFWNSVEELTLVSMQGDIIRCSRQHEPELFKFALGGFGRIGVIADLTIRVKKTQRSLFAVGLVYHDIETFLRDVGKAYADGRFSSIMFAHRVLPTPLFARVSVMGLIVESATEEMATRLHSEIKTLFAADIVGNMDLYELGGTDEFGASFGFGAQHFTLDELAYWYPDRGEHGPGVVNTWSDYLVPPHAYKDFLTAADRIIDAYDLRPWLMRERVKHFLDYRLEGGFVVNMASSNELWGDEMSRAVGSPYVFGYGLFPTLPVAESERGIRAVAELTDEAIRLGGKRYLYGVHAMSKEQTIAQFGDGIIRAWNDAKRRTDPKALLNRGVIPHLDEML